MMNRNSIARILTLAAALSVVLGVLAVGQATLTLAFREMDPHLGQAFSLRIVEERSGREVFRVAVPEIAAAMFDLEIGDLAFDTSYRVDFYADHNGNGLYDPPPVDHAWRVELPGFQVDTIVPIQHNTEFVDIGWPPQPDGVIEPLEYDGMLDDPSTGMSVHWEHDAELLYVGLTAPGTGWLSIGFGPERMMQGANIVIGAIVDEALSIEDHYGNAPTSHRKDDIDHIVQAAGREINGESILEFAIPLDSGDAQDKTLLPGRKVVVILAYHSSNDRLTSRHTARSTVSLELAE